MLRAFAQLSAPTGATMAMVAVLVEAHLRSIPRRRALRFVQAVNEVFDRPTPIGTSREEAAATAAARELWGAALPRILKMLG